MLKTHDRVLTRTQSSTQEQQLSNVQKTLNPNIPDLSFKSKSELRRLIESLCWEIAKLKNNESSYLNEMLRLKKQRTNDLIELSEQKDLIISLYSKVNKNSESSPLKIAG